MLYLYIFVNLEVILTFSAYLVFLVIRFIVCLFPISVSAFLKLYLFISLLCLSVNQELLYVCFKSLESAVSLALFPSGGYNPIIHDFHKHYITKESNFFIGGAMALFFTKYSPLVGSFLLSQCRWL